MSLIFTTAAAMWNKEWTEKLGKEINFYSVRVSEYKNRLEELQKLLTNTIYLGRDETQKFEKELETMKKYLPFNEDILKKFQKQLDELPTTILELEKKLKEKKVEITTKMEKNDKYYREAFNAAGFPINPTDEWQYDYPEDKLDAMDELLELMSNMWNKHVNRPGQNLEDYNKFLQMPLSVYTKGTMKVALVIDEHYNMCRECDMGYDDCNHTIRFSHAIITANLRHTFDTRQWHNLRRIIEFVFVEDDTILNCITQLVVYLSKKLCFDSDVEYRYSDDSGMPEMTFDFEPGFNTFYNWLETLNVKS